MGRRVRCADGAAGQGQGCARSQAEQWSRARGSRNAGHSTLVCVSLVSLLCWTWHAECSSGPSRPGPAASSEDPPNGGSPAAAEDAEEGSKEAVPACVHYVLDSTWVHGREWNQRVMELAPPRAPAADGAGEAGRPHSSCNVSSADDNIVRRILLPRRYEDIQLLRLLSAKHLRVELWPQRTKQPHLTVRVLTDAVSFSTDVNRQRSSWFPPRRRWLIFFQTILDLPDGVSLLSCNFEWRWATWNGTQQSSFPQRALEVSCPLRSRGFLHRDRTVGSRGNSPRERLLYYMRLLLLGILVGTCICQVVLLVICVAVIMIQVAQQRGRVVARRG